MRRLQRQATFSLSPDGVTNLRHCGLLLTIIHNRAYRGFSRDEVRFVCERAIGLLEQVKESLE